MESSSVVLVRRWNSSAVLQPRTRAQFTRTIAARNGRDVVCAWQNFRASHIVRVASLLTTRGSGPRAVLVLHGFLGSGRNLGSLAQLIASRLGDVKLVLPDLLGHGTSPPLPDGADLGTLADAALELSRGLSPKTPQAIVG